MKKLVNNKRGEGELLEQFPKILLTVAVMIGIFLLVSSFLKINLNIKPVEVEVLFNRLMYSPNSIIYTDNITGRVYPGIISLDNFTNETLDRAISYSYERHISAKLELYDSSDGLIDTIYLNGLWYNRLEPLAVSGQSGSSSATIQTRTMPIVYRKNAINSPGKIIITIILPN